MALRRCNWIESKELRRKKSHSVRFFFIVNVVFQYGVHNKHNIVDCVTIEIDCKNHTSEKRKEKDREREKTKEKPLHSMATLFV